MISVAILGGTGYTALELIRILLRHPEARISAITSRDEARPRIDEVHPSLYRRIDLRCELFDAKSLAERGVQYVFGCLPHGASAVMLAECLERGMKVIDLSADFRLRSAEAYKHWYHGDHPAPHLLAEAVYGLPEMYRNEIRGARLVANPGCYPQTAILGLKPLVKSGMMDLDSAIVNSASGVSGAGRQPKMGNLYPECNESMSAYSIGEHRHQPEMEQALSDAAGQLVRLLFAPHLAPMDRGILSTMYVAMQERLTAGEVEEMFESDYEGEPFVRVRKKPPATKDVWGTNYVDLCPMVRGGRIVIVAAEDNLVRGASGVAVQNFNLMAAFDETTGLV